MSFEAGGSNDHSAPAYTAREDGIALAAEVDLDSLVTALFEADYENYLSEEYIDDLKQGMQRGGNPISVMMQAVLTTFIHGFYKGLMWEDWRKKTTEKESIK